MGFFKRNWRELLVAGIFIALIIGLAVAAPYFAPVYFLMALDMLAPTAAVVSSALGLAISPMAIIYGIAAVSALVWGLVSGFATRIIRNCCCSPSEEQNNNDRQAAEPSAPPAYSPPSYDAGQQQSYLATQFAAAPQAEQVFFIPSADPLQTTQGPYTPGFLQTNTGEFRGRGWMSQFGFHPEPTQTTAPPPTYVAPDITIEMEPVYIATNPGASY